MIHDGLAENGHYYTYLFDRIQNVWWKLNDHDVSMVDENIVMDEALGGKGYKSACNLFYINSHIADQFDNQNSPVYSQEFASKLPIMK